METCFDKVRINKFFLFFYFFITFQKLSDAERNFISKNFVTLQNVECSTLDERFCRFALCEIKKKFLSQRILLLKPPVKEASASIAIYQSKSKKPFANFTVDLCDYIAKRNNHFLNFFFKLFSSYSNMNHTCPYANDLIVEKLPTQIPVWSALNGISLVHIQVNAYNVPRAVIKLFIAT